MDPLTSKKSAGDEPGHAEHPPEALDALTILLSVLSACVVSYAVYSLVLV